MKAGTRFRVFLCSATSMRMISIPAKPWTVGTFLTAAPAPAALRPIKATTRPECLARLVALREAGPRAMRPLCRRWHRLGCASDNRLDKGSTQPRAMDAAAFFLRLSALKPRPGRLGVAWEGRRPCQDDLRATTPKKHNPGHFYGRRDHALIAPGHLGRTVTSPRN
ncbi:MAG: hypothetical protein KatS3mg038_1444 [Candidatus Kapaibacterium sp.]|nr:MAG: hypothetical protein KatS3mg038_1444 [Candidatus Kapabacteria bacterium]